LNGLKIISLEKAEGGQGTVDWLKSQDLIPNLLSFLSFGLAFADIVMIAFRKSPAEV
jgi:hypothetical protein